MSRLEELTRGALVKGVRTDGPVEVVDVKWFGTAALELTYKDSQGRPGNELLYRDAEGRLEVATKGPAWSFDADGHLFRLVSEAYRIRLAYLFDPLLAVHTSLVEPLPHQIKAVYGDMLSRQPLRFLLADDPGAGKTIMAGLFIKELVDRGDLMLGPAVPSRVIEPVGRPVPKSGAKEAASSSPAAFPERTAVIVVRTTRRLRRLATFLGPGFRYEPSQDAFVDGCGTRVSRCGRPYHWQRSVAGHPITITGWPIRGWTAERDSSYLRSSGYSDRRSRSASCSHMETPSRNSVSKISVLPVRAGRFWWQRLCTGSQRVLS